MNKKKKEKTPLGLVCATTYRESHIGHDHIHGMSID
jgi:hypothetical protein